jgi:hypothetical protein
MPSATMPTIAKRWVLGEHTSLYNGIRTAFLFFVISTVLSYLLLDYFLGCAMADA